MRLSITNDAEPQNPKPKPQIPKPQTLKPETSDPLKPYLNPKPPNPPNPTGNLRPPYKTQISLAFVRYSTARWHPGPQPDFVASREHRVGFRV